MNIVADPESLAELISDCASLPDSVRHPAPAAEPAGQPAVWRVDDACFAQVAGLDNYGSSPAADRPAG